MDIVNIKLGRPIFTNFAYIYEFLDVDSFDSTNKNIKARKLQFKELKLPFLRFASSKFYLYILEINILIFCDLLQFTISLSFSQD